MKFDTESMFLKKFSCVLALLLLLACKQNSEDTIEFEPVIVDKTVALSNDDVPPTCSVHLSIEQATATSGHRAEVVNTAIMSRLLDREDATVQAAAEAFADDYTSTYLKTMLPLYNQDRADTAKRAWYEYHYVINTNTQLGSRGTVVYIANIDYYEGGAHGINQTFTMNFEEKTGRLLAVDDIFDSGYEPLLKEKLLQALKSKTGLSTMKELTAKGYLYSMDIFAPQNFILGDETITFIYNPYEIAPYALGSTELTIRYNDIKDILNKNFEY